MTPGASYQAIQHAALAALRHARCANVAGVLHGWRPMAPPWRPSPGDALVAPKSRHHPTSPYNPRKWGSRPFPDRRCKPNIIHDVAAITPECLNSEFASLMPATIAIGEVGGASPLTPMPYSRCSVYGRAACHNHGLMLGLMWKAAGK